MNPILNHEALMGRLDDLSRADLAALPASVIQVDDKGLVTRHGAVSDGLLGFQNKEAVGRDFFRDLAPSTHIPAFHGRFLDGVRRGLLDERFQFTFGFEPEPVRVEVRMRSAREPNRYWIVMRTIAVLNPSAHRSTALAASEAIERRSQTLPVDPALCEREPIHIPGAVQPHAVMLTCDPESFVVQVCSDNVGDALETADPATLIGEPLETLVSAELALALREALAAGELADPALPFRSSTRLGRASTPFAVSAHVHDERLVLELERVPERPEDFEAATPLQAQSAVTRLRGADTLAGAAQAAARAIRAMTRFERVLVYRFDPDWNGEAIAEDKTADWEQSLLGLRFPASDIPAQARALYAKSTSRFVVDRDAVPAAVMALPQAANQAVDLTFAHARALSPIHLEYQRNLGVNGSMSISILVEGKLWGLVIGHHRRPHYVTPETRALAGLVTDAFALRVHELESLRAWREQEATLGVRNALLEKLAGSDDFITALTEVGGKGVTLLDLFVASGAAIVSGGRVAVVGSAPTPNEIVDLTTSLCGEPLADRRVFATDQLSNHYAKACSSTLR